RPATSYAATTQAGSGGHGRSLLAPSAPVRGAVRVAEAAREDRPAAALARAAGPAVDRAQRSCSVDRRAHHPLRPAEGGVELLVLRAPDWQPRREPRLP